jgi:hypothetical protein
MAPSRTPAVPDLLYRTLVWLVYRLAVVFLVGLPLVLLVWSGLRKEGAMLRLLTLYWKVASLMGITVLLLAGGQPLGYVLGVIGQLLIVAAVWFWVDLNEELADRPPWRPLPLTVRAWRWAVTVFALLGAALSASGLSCVSGQVGRPLCQVWLEAPQGLQLGAAKVFGFVFGADLTPPLTAFLGYMGLAAYAVGLLQWLLVRLPRQGRVAGGF